MPVSVEGNQWTLVIPVKPLHVAKSRLVGFTGPRRAELALALAVDTVTAAIASPAVVTVIVVTDDAVVTNLVHSLNAIALPDTPAAGLNSALHHGAMTAIRGAPIGALVGDLPALRTVELTRLLRAAAEHPTSYLADTAGNGTTVYLAREPQLFSPAFGPDSAHRHATTGATPLALVMEPDSVASVRRDVDTVEDLRLAAALGVGPRTAAFEPAPSNRYH
jgi:2-phospho-L-lactate/phosphoenolpyruvate guanylyltransferase